MRPVAILLLSCGLLLSQKPAQLNQRDSLALAERIGQLAASTAAIDTELTRTTAPTVENIGRAVKDLHLASGQPAHLTYALLAQLRAYLALADLTPKPLPLADEARRQFGELRECEQRLDGHFRALLEAKETQLRGSDRDNLRRHAEANAKLGPPQAGKQRVVFLGDSITDGWRLNEYFGDRDFVNRGISGQITGEMLGRMKADVIDNKPEAMILLAGTNDIARGVPVETIQNNLTTICELASLHKIKVILASILPVSDYHKDQNPRYEMTKGRPPATILTLNAWIRDYAKQRGHTYCNYFDAVADAQGFLKAELADDGLHPNPAGYRLMAPVALASIDAALKPVSEPKPERKRRWPF